MKILLGIALALGIAAAAYGAAATLIVDGGTVQYGSDTTLQCDTDGFQVYYGTAGSPLAPTVDTVTVGGISDNCAGRSIQVALSDGTATPLFTSAWTPVGIAPVANAAIPVPGTVSVASVTDVHITVR